MARASVAAHSRRDRSVNTGDKAACFARSEATSTGEPYHAVISQYTRLMFDGPLERRGRIYPMPVAPLPRNEDWLRLAEDQRRVGHNPAGPKGRQGSDSGCEDC